MDLTTSLPREVVETQLARIMDSRMFFNAPRLSRFLSHVVQESLEGRVDRLKGYTIGLDVFDRPEDFDPQTDTIVRVQARALRQKLGQYYAQDGLEDPVHIKIAKGAYEPKFLVPNGGGKLKDSDKPLPAATSISPSIAVLPFDDFSLEKNRQSFSLGLTEEIIANLSRFRELSVFSRSTTEKAKLDKLSISQMYAAFRPDFVLEGSFRLSEHTVDITINLVVASSDAVILTKHFSREMTPNAMYAVQDEMAQMIAARIADRFGPLEQYAQRRVGLGRSQKWETYHWISQYHQYGIQLDQIDRSAIKEGLTKALETDGNSADAHATLALIMLDEYRVSIDKQPDKVILEQALAQAQKAVVCDPESATAQEALAIARFHRGEFEQFDAAARQALVLNPGHGDMLAALGICYTARVNWDTAMPLLDKAIALNPLQPGWYHVPRAIGLAMTGRAREAVAEMQISPLPGMFFYHCHMIWFLVEANDVDAAMEEKDRLLEALPEFEHFIMGHFRAWCTDDALVRRAVAGWRSVGLNIRS
ncbi:putative integral membrane protein [Hoeflea sp. IMCC20628]|uniref:tetratricopeptide repeat protein n=1 Tax=Hoeflea sp. IMCC20628 TaxID=1620421 RepID=UPI00063AA63C|nr:hypothetical protein [Hoeflea sp. IMCC20628]AKH98783.1 putative integral membrane protein [Hoeflea sp. IMCC20628]